MATRDSYTSRKTRLINRLSDRVYFIFDHVDYGLLKRVPGPPHEPAVNSPGDLGLLDMVEEIIMQNIDDLQSAERILKMWPTVVDGRLSTGEKVVSDAYKFLTDPDDRRLEYFCEFIGANADNIRAAARERFGNDKLILDCVGKLKCDSGGGIDNDK